MPKRKPGLGPPRGLVTLAVLAFLAFAGGEVYRLSGSDAGHLLIARSPWIGDPAEVTRIIGRTARGGLTAVGVPADSVRDVGPSGSPLVRWHVGLRSDQSLLQANEAVTRRLEEIGAHVLAGRETVGRRGETLVTLTLGLPGKPTHVIVLAHSAETGRAAGEAGPARVALVLYGFGDDAVRAAEMFAIPVPFAVALPPATPASGAMFRAARKSGREVVLHLPLEPINYPQVNPGPGAVLVTMSPSEITGMTRRYIDQAGPVAGVANHMGSLATQDMTVMTAVYRELKRRNLPFIHVMPAAGAVCRALAAQLGVSYEEPDAVLDQEPKTSGAKPLEQRWSAVLESARKSGHMVVWVRATPLTQAWLPHAADPRRLGGVSLVPLSSLLRKPPLL
jgi:polysaccharide deacetylase 2 family uncharacterized protein YibQ